MPNTSIDVVLAAYSKISGKDVVAAPEVKAIKKPIDLVIEKMPIPEAIDRMQRVLRDQVGVEIVSSNHGSVIARLVGSSPQKP